jgi:hypothetical protein
VKRYASIRFDRAIGPVNAAGAFIDSIKADDVYVITREGDDVTVIEIASGVTLEAPWSRVISASPLSEPLERNGETLREHNSDVEPAQIDEEKVATLAPRKGGWPKGKPRKPVAEGGEA